VWTIESRAGVTVAQLNNGTGDQRHFYAYNTLYSVHALNDQTGSLKEGYQYEAYGKRTILTPTWAVKAVQTSAVENQNGFTSRYHDAETGLVYFRARIYAPLIGRFISRDPISSGPKSQMGQGVNHDISLRNMQRVQYSFAPKAQQIVASYQADFIPNYTDPSGLLPDKPQQTCKIGPCTDAEIKAASDACDSAQGFYDQALRAVALVSFAAGLELGANIGADIGVGIAIDYAATCGKARDAACSADCCRGSENCHEANPPPPLPPMPVPFDTSKLGWEMLAR